MSVPNVIVSYGPFGSSVNLSNVQSVNGFIGRRKVTDPFRSGSFEVTGRRPDLLPTIEIGGIVEVFIDYLSVTSSAFSGRVADFRIDYGTISSMDTWTITLEDHFAYAGRATVSATVASGSATVTTAVVLGATCGVSVSGFSTFPSKSTVKALTLSNENFLDVLNVLINTEQGYADANSAGITFYGRNWQSGVTFYAASDDGTGTNPIVYDKLTFTTLADNYATGTEVTIRGGNTVTAGTTEYVYAIDTYSQTDADATQVANFVNSQLTTQTPVIVSVSVLVNRQTNTTWQSVIPSTGLNVKFRGTTYKAFCLGRTISSDVEQTRVTYHLASADFYQYLILNDATFGKLDNNRLGF